MIGCFSMGTDLKEGKAKADFDENGNPIVTLEMKEAEQIW